MSDVCLACGLFQCEDCADEHGCCCGRVGPTEREDDDYCGDCCRICGACEAEGELCDHVSSATSSAGYITHAEDQS